MSGIYIKGMEMPKTGTVIAIYRTKGKFYAAQNGKTCPLISVPDHGRLIDADVLRDSIDDPNWCVWISDINDSPTVIPEDYDA